MTHEFREPTTAELMRFYDAAILPKIDYAEGMFQDGELIAVGGILSDPVLVGSPIEEVARSVAFLDVKRQVRGADVLRRLRMRLNKERRMIWVQHDDAFPQSERLLKVLGFIQTRETRNDFKHTGRKLRMWCRPVGVR